MAIASLDDLAPASVKGVNAPFQRASIASAVTGNEMSLWRGTGFPAQGAIPSAAAICNSATTGAFPLAPRTGGQERVASLIVAQMATIGHTLLLQDRLAHMGGLNGTLTTAQTVNVDVSGATDNLPERIGPADFSEVEWYLEWYTATGATISTPTVNVTFHDNTTAGVNIWVLGATALPASVAASRRYKIVTTNGKFIKSVQSVQLSASTGTAGNFGVTAVRSRATFVYSPVTANAPQAADWLTIGAGVIADNSCLTLSQICATTTTGASSGIIRQAVA